MAHRIVEYLPTRRGELRSRSAAEILEEGRRLARRRPTVVEYRRKLERDEERFHADVEWLERSKRVRLLRRVQATERLRGVCIHEAGHAVMGTIDGAGIDSLELDLAEGFGGVEVQGGLYRARHAERLTARTFVAGEEAASLAGVWLPETWSSSDGTKAEATGEDVGLARVAARELLARYWPAVHGLAEELQRFGYVSGRNAEALVFACGVPA